MRFHEISILGCFLLEPPVFEDSRGRFIKPMEASVFAEHGLRNDFVEQYYSTSVRNVIRGMHFQLPPRQHAKLVYPLLGEVRDVILDLRHGSPTFRQYCALTLDAQSARAVYIAEGVAHGFLAITDLAIMVYNVTSEHSSTHDAGIRWDSFGYDWAVDFPIISDRDRRHPPLSLNFSGIRL